MDVDGVSSGSDAPGTPTPGSSSPTLVAPSSGASPTMAIPKGSPSVNNNMKTVVSTK